MRIIHDPSRCASTGMCEEAAPELFEVRPDGMLHVLDQEPPTHLLAAAQRAVRSCPTAALRLEP